MNELLFEQVKEALGENEYLFNKLHKVGQQYEDIDFDESGLYEEEEETVLRRWDKLSSKIEKSLNENLENVTVKIRETVSPQEYVLKLDFIYQEEEEDILSSLNIDYSKIGELSIFKV